MLVVQNLLGTARKTRYLGLVNGDKDGGRWEASPHYRLGIDGTPAAWRRRSEVAVYCKCSNVECYFFKCYVQNQLRETFNSK